MSDEEHRSLKNLLPLSGSVSGEIRDVLSIHGTKYTEMEPQTLQLHDRNAYQS